MVNPTILVLAGPNGADNGSRLIVEGHLGDTIAIHDSELWDRIRRDHEPR